MTIKLLQVHVCTCIYNDYYHHYYIILYVVTKLINWKDIKPIVIVMIISNLY